MIAAFILGCFLSTGRGDVHYSKTADYLEVNTVLQKDSVVLRQVIVWAWCPLYKRYHCLHWHMLDTLDDYPRWRHGLWHCGGFSAKRIEVSWTSNDPEIDNRKLFPTEYRQRIIQTK